MFIFCTGHWISNKIKYSIWFEGWQYLSIVIYSGTFSPSFVLLYNQYSTNICHHFFFIHFKYFHLMTYFSGVNIDFVAFSYHWINFNISPSSHTQHRESVKHFWLKMYLELQKSIENQFSNLSRELLPTILNNCFQEVHFKLESATNYNWK